MTASNIIWKKPVAAASTANIVSTFIAVSAGGVVTTNNLTQPTGGTLETGTWPNVSLTGGTGSGALAAVVVIESGVLTVDDIVQPTGGTNSFIAGTNGNTGTFTAGNTIQQASSIATLGSITGGSGYGNGTYTSVPLTGSSGSGAQATIVVSGGAVTSVTLSADGTGYNVGETLSATNANLGNQFTVAGTNGNTGTFTAGNALLATPSGATAVCAVTNADATPLLIKTIVGTPTASDVWSDTTTPGATFHASAAPVASGSGFSVPVATTNGATAIVAVTNANATPLVVTTSSISGTPDATDIWTDTSTGLATFTPTAVPSFVSTGTYTGISLTGGSGSGAVATIVVSGGLVTTVTLTTSGTGYLAGDVLGFTGTYLGTGGTVTTATFDNIVSSVTITNPGAGYLVGDTLTYGDLPNDEVGSGGTVTVLTISPSGPGDTLTASSNAVLTVDTYTPVVGDRILVKNQSTGLRNGVYNLTQANSSGMITGTTGPIASVGSITQPTGGTVTAGNYTSISLTGGHGSSAVATIQVASDQVISIVITTPGSGYETGDVLGYTGSGLGTGGTATVTATGATVQPSGGTIKNGTYLGVPLTGGTGSGALATVVVTSNAVTGVYVTNPGSGYANSDVLTYNANGQGFGNGGTITVVSVTVPFSGSGAEGGLILTTGTLVQPSTDLVTNGTYGDFPLTGGTGTGATANITITNGVVSSVVIVNPGTGYVISDSLGFSGTANTPTQGLGSGGTITVSSTTYLPWILTRTADANLALQIAPMAVWVANGSQANTAWVQNTLAVTLDTTPLTFVELVA